MRFFRNPNINFMTSRKLAFIFSGTLILISIISLIIHGGPHYSVDFRGGTFMEIRFEDKNDPDKPIDIPISEVREVFSEFGLGNAEIKHYGSNQEISARTDVIQESDALMHSITDRLSQRFPEYNVIEMRKETVGPKVGKELVGAAILAIFWAIIFILIYIMWRFELRFGVGAVVALVHDVIITVGVFSVLNLEISIAIVAALLTIVGYSLNDTIVVFDRIRENLKSLKRQVFEYDAVVNRSINETLSRTIVTSGTTLLVVLVLYFFGGEVIKDFAFALICGIVIGTYSSIYVASPVLVEWETRKRIKTGNKK
ncbi:MAG: protein translocase subunit SecF [Calditrichia bacterium]